MLKQNRRIGLPRGVTRSVPPILLFLLLDVILSGSILISPDSGSSGLPWNGYYTIVYKKKGTTPFDTAIIKARLKASGLVSEDTSKESFDDFGKSEDIAIADLEKRFDPLDPRYDAYLRNIGKYFDAGEGFKVMYVKSSFNPLFFYIASHLYFTPITESFRIIGFDPGNHLFLIVSALVFACAVVIVTSAGRGQRMIAIIGALPWIPIMIPGDLSDVLGFCLIYPYFLFFSRFFIDIPMNPSLYKQKPNHRLKRTGYFIFYTGIVFSCFIVRKIISSHGIPAGPLFPVTCDFLLILLMYRPLNFKKKPSGGKISSSLQSIKPDNILRSSNLKKAEIIIINLLAICLIMLYYIAIPCPANIRIACPVRTGKGGAVSLDDYAGLMSMKSEKSFPDISDFLTHRAFQQGFEYGTTYDFPVNKKVTLPYFSVDANGTHVISKKNLTLVTFDNAWFMRELGAVKPDSLEKMLIEQPGLVRVENKTLSDAVYPIIKPELSCIIFFFLAAFAFCIDRYLTFGLLYVTKTSGPKFGPGKTQANRRQKNDNI
jgi:hypothetical protein